MRYSLLPLQIGKTCERFTKPSESADVRHRKLLNTAGGVDRLQNNRALSGKSGGEFLATLPFHAQGNGLSCVQEL